MLKFSASELVQPSLLDRLTDHQPGNREDSTDQRAFSPRMLLAAILRDLTWLLNAPALDATVDLRRYPEVASSVLNYGTPALHGHSREGIGVDALRQQMLVCLRRFEPRLIPGSLSVVALGEDAGETLSFRIEGSIRADPVPLRMVMYTKLDTELDAITVVEARRGAA